MQRFQLGTSYCAQQPVLAFAWSTHAHQQFQSHLISLLAEWRLDQTTSLQACWWPGFETGWGIALECNGGHMHLSALLARNHWIIVSGFESSPLTECTLIFALHFARIYASAVMSLRSRKHHCYSWQGGTCLHARYRKGDRPPAPRRSFRNLWDARCAGIWRRAFYMFSLGECLTTQT